MARWTVIYNPGDVPGGWEPPEGADVVGSPDRNCPAGRSYFIDNEMMLQFPSGVEF